MADKYDPFTGSIVSSSSSSNNVRISDGTTFTDAIQNIDTMIKTDVTESMRAIMSEIFKMDLEQFGEDWMEVVHILIKSGISPESVKAVKVLYGKTNT